MKKLYFITLLFCIQSLYICSAVARLDISSDTGSVRSGSMRSGMSDMDRVNVLWTDLISDLERKCILEAVRTFSRKPPTKRDGASWLYQAVKLLSADRPDLVSDVALLGFIFPGEDEVPHINPEMLTLLARSNPQAIAAPRTHLPALEEEDGALDVSDSTHPALAEQSADWDDADSLWNPYIWESFLEPDEQTLIETAAKSLLPSAIAYTVDLGIKLCKHLFHQAEYSDQSLDSQYKVIDAIFQEDAGMNVIKRELLYLATTYFLQEISDETDPTGSPTCEERALADLDAFSSPAGLGGSPAVSPSRFKPLVTHKASPLGRHQTKPPRRGSLGAHVPSTEGAVLGAVAGAGGGGGEGAPAGAGASGGAVPAPGEPAPHTPPQRKGLKRPSLPEGLHTTVVPAMGIVVGAPPSAQTSNKGGLLAQAQGASKDNRREGAGAGRRTVPEPAPLTPVAGDSRAPNPSAAYGSTGDAVSPDDGVAMTAPVRAALTPGALTQHDAALGTPGASSTNAAIGRLPVHGGEQNREDELRIPLLGGTDISDAKKCCCAIL